MRRLANDSDILIDKLIFVAGLGMAQSALNLAMSEAAAAGNLGDLDRLTSHVAPFSRDERSSRRVFTGEFTYGQAMVATYPSTPEALLARERQHHQILLDSGSVSRKGYYPEPELVTELELALTHEKMQRDLVGITELGKVVILISERTAADYWGKGTDLIAQDLIDRPEDAQQEKLTLMAWYGWESYFNSYRILDLRYLVLQALGDVYAGQAVAGIPARPAPAHWAWEWLEGEQDLCLLAVSAHPTVSEGVNGTNRVCSHYWQ